MNHELSKTNRSTMVAAENFLEMGRGEESINEFLSHAYSAYCDFYNNVMLVSKSRYFKP